MKLLLVLASSLLLGRVASAGTVALPTPKTVEIFGQTIRYYEAGSGPTIVLLHGLGSSAEGDWGRILPTLASRYHVLALDHLGFGGSAKPMIDYRIQTWVDFLGEFLRQEHVGAFTLAGESLGGWIAAQYTLQALQDHPIGPSFALPKPSRLVLCDAAGHRPAAGPPPSVPMDTASLEGCRNLCAAIFYDPSYHTDEAVRAFFQKSLAKRDGYTVHAFFTNPAIGGEWIDGKLGGISVPTLVIWGDHDSLVPLDDGRDYAQKIPGAHLVVIPKAGHAACIEQPEAFLAAFLPFVAKSGTGG